jgi:hypothetical protein
MAGIKKLGGSKGGVNVKGKSKAKKANTGGKAGSLRYQKQMPKMTALAGKGNKGPHNVKMNKSHQAEFKSVGKPVRKVKANTPALWHLAWNSR